MKKFLTGLLVLMLALTSSACNVTAGKVVTFADLFADPEYYNSREIIIEGYYFSGWETIVLAENLDYYLSSRKALAPGGRMMWVEGGIPKDIYDKLYEQSAMGPTERFGKVKMTGKFQYGGQYGHLGAYDAQITPEKVELLDWTPPG